MLQEACASQVTWDDPIPQPLVMSWKSWLKVLPCLNQVTMLRRFILNSRVSNRIESHVFSDASLIR